MEVSSLNQRGKHHKMKKYAALLTMLAFAGVQTGFADVLGMGDVTFDGSLEVKGQQANNETDLAGPQGDHLEPADMVKGRLEFVRTAGGTGGTVAQFGDGASTLAGEEGAIQIQNAYLSLEDFLHTDRFSIGRQYVGRPGDLLVYYGPVADDSLTVTALDSVSVGKKWNKFNINFVSGKVAEDDAVANADADDATGDTNISYITIATDELIPDVKVPLELGFYSGTNAGGPASGDNNNLTIIDLRAGYSLMDDMVKLGLEYAMNGGGANGGATSPPAPAGTTLNYKGNALLLSARYDNDDEGWGVGLRYANASGDDKGDEDDESFRDFTAIGAASSDYRYGEIMSYDNTAAALAGVNLGGLDTGSQGAGANIIALEGWYQLPWWDNKLKAMAGYYIAKLNEVAAGADDGIGSEIDLSVNYAHSETMGASLGYATFSPDKGLSQLAFPAAANPPQDDVTKITAKLWVKWGGDRMY
jgi:hypothetical protein